MKPTSSSNEDLSEYTDADESISAPTEFLAEFLSAVMLKDYETALKYCKLILQYEPNNATAKEFYPLILEKLQHINNAADDGISGGESNESDDEDDASNSSSSTSESDSDDSSDIGQEDEEEEEGIEVEKAGDKQSKGSSDGDATTGSYSSLEDDEAETVDQLAALAARYQIDNFDLGNGNKIYGTNLAPIHNITKDKLLSNGGNSLITTGNQLPFGTSSDSESPTEPVSQQTVAMLRARVVPNKI